MLNRKAPWQGPDGFSQPAPTATSGLAEKLKAWLEGRNGNVATETASGTRQDLADLRRQLDRHAVRKKENDERMEMARAEQYAELQREAERAIWLANATDLIEKKGSLETWLTTGDPGEVNHTLRLLVKQIVVSPDRIEIQLK